MCAVMGLRGASWVCCIALQGFFNEAREHIKEDKMGKGVMEMAGWAGQAVVCLA